MSEIVGALMLTLIVVIAASSFAIFISQRQEASQDQQLLEQRRALENITVLFVDPYMNATSTTTWESLNFTISSLYIGESHIDSVWIGGLPLHNGTLWRIGDDGALSKVDYSFQEGIDLDKLEHVYLNVTAENFFESGMTFSAENNVNIELRTELLNEFHVNFIPPTAIMTVDVLPIWNNTAGHYDMAFLLDASLSDQVQPGYIMHYDWKVLNSAGTTLDVLTGRKVLSQVQLAAGDRIILTVTNNFGMKSTETIVY